MVRFPEKSQRLTVNGFGSGHTVSGQVTQFWVGSYDFGLGFGILGFPLVGLSYRVTIGSYTLDL